MTTINPQVQQLAAALRGRLAVLRAPAFKFPQTAQKVKSKKGLTAESSPQDVAGMLALKVQKISKDDPNFKPKVFHLFLESVFLAEFGGALADDVRFADLINAVQRQMERDPDLNALIDQAIGDLIQG